MVSRSASFRAIPPRSSHGFYTRMELMTVASTMQMPWQFLDGHKKLGVGAGGAYDHLADQPPWELQDMLQRAIRWDYVDNYHFQRAFLKLHPEALQELFERLFGR